jgi:hypothetical protein
VTVTERLHDPDLEVFLKLQKKVKLVEPPPIPLTVNTPSLAEEIEMGLIVAIEGFPPLTSKLPTVTPSPDMV